jgi:hypothetical protein
MPLSALTELTCDLTGYCSIITFVTLQGFEEHCVIYSLLHLVCIISRQRTRKICLFVSHLSVHLMRTRIFVCSVVWCGIELWIPFVLVTFCCSQNLHLFMMIMICRCADNMFYATATHLLDIGQVWVDESKSNGNWWWLFEIHITFLISDGIMLLYWNGG